MDDEKPSENDLVIGTPARVLVVIKPDGRLVYGEGYTPDEAASALWEALARRRVEAERTEPNRIRVATTDEQALLEMEQRFNEWEPAMITLAKADAANEIAQTQRNQLVGCVPDRSPQMERAKAKATQADNYFNECAVAIIMLARAHAKRTQALHEIDARDLPPAEATPDAKKMLN